MILILDVSVRCMFLHLKLGKAFWFLSVYMIVLQHFCPILGLELSQIDTDFLSVWLYEYRELNDKVHIFIDAKCDKLHVIIQM